VSLLLLFTQPATPPAPIPIQDGMPIGLLLTLTYSGTTPPTPVTTGGGYHLWPALPIVTDDDDVIFLLMLALMLGRNEEIKL
jgi:hypothetical protein